MREILAACAFVLSLAGCGGGGGSGEVPSASNGPPSPPAPITIDYTEYAPFRQPFTHHLFSFGTWSVKQVGEGAFDVQWGGERGSVEEQRIRKHMGEDWLFLDAYFEPVPKYRYVSRATKSEITRDGGRTWQDVTPEGETSLYAPIKFTGPVTIRQWGWIQDDPGHCAAVGTPEEQCKKVRRWFHQHTLTPVKDVYNSCWLAPDRIKDGIKQEEVWWDQHGGFLRGTAKLGPDGEPDGTGIVYQWHQVIAKDTGYVWTGADGLCLIQ